MNSSAATDRATLERFARHGISADRLILEGGSPRAEYFAAYNRIDIALSRSVPGRHDHRRRCGWACRCSA
jgi:hypothetical protein